MIGLGMVVQTEGIQRATLIFAGSTIVLVLLTLALLLRDAIGTAKKTDAL